MSIREKILSTIKEYFNIVKEVFIMMSFIYFGIFLMFQTLLSNEDMSKLLIKISENPSQYFRSLSYFVFMLIIVIYIFKFISSLDKKNSYKSSLFDDTNLISQSTLIEYATEKYSLLKAHPTDSGFDLKSTEDFTLQPHEIKLISTGIKLKLPKNYEAQVRRKSGLSSKGFMVYLGTVDNEYRVEVKVIVQNNSNSNITIESGQKVAQLVFNKLDNIELVTISNIDENTNRGDNGFGSTGKF